MTQISGIEINENFSEQVHSLFQENNLDIDKARSLVLWSLMEDAQPNGDVTTLATIPLGSHSTARYCARATGVIVGIPILALALESVGLTNYTINVQDGDEVVAGTILCEVVGSTHAILLIERTSLNILSHLSGIATQTSLWVKALSGTKAKVRDTRKTTPLFRQIEKYAVRKGGGLNHRVNLSDEGLIKDNHIVAAGSITAAGNAFKATYPDLPFEIEVDNFEQLEEAVKLEPDWILLDNMSPEQCTQAVELVQGKVKLEASGGMNLQSAAQYGATGVDFISVGALTHSAPNFDIGLDFISSQVLPEAGERK
jgi:nicotinate-nucleotide pyrophosphorylase (carboxylating)